MTEHKDRCDEQPVGYSVLGLDMVCSSCCETIDEARDHFGTDQPVSSLYAWEDWSPHELTCDICGRDLAAQGPHPDDDAHDNTHTAAHDPANN